MKIKQLHPLTITPKLKETAAFYKDYFAFSEVFSSDWYIQLAHKSGAEIAIMLPNQASQAKFLHAPYGGKGIVYTIETDDATKIYHDLKAKKAPIVHELTDEAWGQRHFMLKDPAGVYVDVVQYL